MKDKVFSIPVHYQRWGVINVEADTLEEAKQKVIAADVPPYKSEYVEDSLEIEEDSPLLRYQN